jgi:D-alanyl-lipoteichoic acid acyltransferase DltB (MBOAT superfamily)
MELLLESLVEYLRYDPLRPLLFNSGLFVVLFVVFFAVFVLAERVIVLRLAWTTLFSLFFYYKSSGSFFWILILSTVIDYALGLWLYAAKTPWKRRLLLVLSLIANLGILGYFKYTNFLLEIIAGIQGAPFTPLDIFLPVGISFYTFQTMSYSIDVYRGKLLPERNILDFAFFVSFFPQLVAGPIVRAAEFLPQIRAKLKVTSEDIGVATFLIAGGLFKKAVLSDYLSVNFVDRIFDNPALYSGFENLIGVYAYSLQIYCDFSGYSDMAIGLALLLGFRLPVNFDSPYQSASITEFWRRWHISLSSWLRDYLYIPLGGNRKGTVRTYVNLLLTMLLGGLWHGANWKFVLWGAFHGGMLALEKAFDRVINLPRNAWTRAMGVLLTFHFVAFCWIFFRANSMDDALMVLQQIAFNFNGSIAASFVTAYPYIVLTLVVGYLLHFTPRNIEFYVERGVVASPLVLQSLYIAAVAWLSVQVASSDVVPFIYFQF